MKFNFVAGRHSLSIHTEKPLAGFLDLKSAKDFVIMKELDYLSSGYMYIDTPDGRYVLGVDSRTAMNKWYGPNERAYVYDASHDCSALLDDILAVRSGQW